MRRDESLPRKGRFANDAEGGDNRRWWRENDRITYELDRKRVV